MKGRPEPLARLDLVFETARIAHETIFGLHRRLVMLEADDEGTQGLLRESARITLGDLRALTADARGLAARWDEQSLLAREEADRTLQATRAELERLEPDLQRLRLRQQEIARDLHSRLTEARKR